MGMKDKPFAKTEWASWDSFLPEKLILLECLSLSILCTSGRWRCSRERGLLISRALLEGRT